MLRKVNLTMGLCIGTRLIVTRLVGYVIEAIIIIENNISESVFIPRIKMTAKDRKWPFVFTMK